MLSVEKYQDEFNNFLKNFIPPSYPNNLYDPVKYILSLNGKRIRPILTLLTCDLFIKEYKSALNAALAVEVFHNFSLVHDDIMDEAPLRRGRDTVHRKWDLNTAILSGDVMLILAYQLFENYSGDTFVSLAQLFSKTAIEVCEGQQMDIDFTKQNIVSVSQYLKMIEYKTAVLIGAAMKMGAIVAKASASNQKHIYDFGRNLGLAFQIQDDYLDTFGDKEKFGKIIGGDIIENKKTYLFTRALELLDENNTKKLLNLYSLKSDDSTKKIFEVKQLYLKCDIPNLVKSEIESYTITAFECLEKIDISNTKKDFLRDFGNSLMKRII